MKNKKVVYTIIGIISIALIALAITYAYWQITKSQTNSNVISSACLDISLSNEQNDITLTEQYPITDAEGKELTPYTFTVTNNCNTEVDYYVNLEALGSSDTALKASSIKVMLDSNNPAKLINNSEVTPTISGAYASYKIGVGTLAEKGADGASVTHTLRLWIDESAPVSEANKTFSSKVSVTIGQNISSPFETGTLAHKILSNYDYSSIANYTETGYVVSESSTTSESSYLDRNYYWATSYDFDATTGYYALAGDIVQATITECRNGEKSDGTVITCGQYSFISEDLNISSRRMHVITSFTGTSADPSYGCTVTYKYLSSSGLGLASSTSDGELGFYSAEDDYGTSYYYRGDVENNYVEFGSYASGTTVNGVTYDKETPMYWRIVRINGDGTVRLIYDGTEKLPNGETKSTANIGSDSFGCTGTCSLSYNDIATGYTYISDLGEEQEDGTKQVNSPIKTAIDNWYANNLNDKYGEYIADRVFCNDKREFTSDKYNLNENYTYYESYNRLYINKTPVLTCSRNVDSYTVDSNLGNGYLEYPVGLITADEVLLAGGGVEYQTNNTTFYLYTGNAFVTATPSYVENSTYAYIWQFYSYLSGSEEAYGTRPVINLKADVAFTYNSEDTAGTIDDPYVITTN